MQKNCIMYQNFSIPPSFRGHFQDMDYHIEQIYANKLMYTYFKSKFEN